MSKQSVPVGRYHQLEKSLTNFKEVDTSQRKICRGDSTTCHWNLIVRARQPSVPLWFFKMATRAHGQPKHISESDETCARWTQLKYYSTLLRRLYYPLKDTRRTHEQIATS